MGDIKFSFPDADSPAQELTLISSLVTVAAPPRRPIQVVNVAVDGTVYRNTLSSNRERILRITFDSFPEDDDGSYSGMTSIENFFDRIVNYSEFPFDVTDADGDIFAVYYLSGLENFREGGTSQQPGISGEWYGEIMCREKVT